jgi:hypothetical protein
MNNELLRALKEGVPKEERIFVPYVTGENSMQLWPTPSTLSEPNEVPTICCDHGYVGEPHDCLREQTTIEQRVDQKLREAASRVNRAELSAEYFSRQSKDCHPEHIMFPGGVLPVDPAQIHKAKLGDEAVHPTGPGKPAAKEDENPEVKVTPDGTLVVRLGGTIKRVEVAGK